MKPSSLFTYSEARKIVDTYSDLAIRKVIEVAERDPNDRIYAIWDTQADEWLIAELARKMLNGSPPWEGGA